MCELQEIGVGTSKLLFRPFPYPCFAFQVGRMLSDYRGVAALMGDHHADQDDAENKYSTGNDEGQVQPG